MNELNEFEMEVERTYDEWVMKTENRNISYGEMAYIQSLGDKDLKEFYDELCNQLYGGEDNE